MADPVENKGTENNNPAGQPNAAGDAPAMPSITAELGMIVNLAGSYAQSANFVNNAAGSMLLALEVMLPLQDERLNELVQSSEKMGMMFANLESLFGIVSQKLAEAQVSIPSIPIDPEIFQTSERTKA